MRFLERHGIPYHHLSTAPGNKREQEILGLVEDTNFLVLARYMQVLNAITRIFHRKFQQDGPFLYLTKFESGHFFFLWFKQKLGSVFIWFKQKKRTSIAETLRTSYAKENIDLQVLSGGFLHAYGKDIINIHHGLLPSFKGGNPSRQVLI